MGDEVPKRRDERVPLFSLGREWAQRKTESIDGSPYLPVRRQRAITSYALRA